MITLEKTDQPLHTTPTGELYSMKRAWLFDFNRWHAERDVKGMRQAMAFHRLYSNEIVRRLRRIL